MRPHSRIIAVRPLVFITFGAAVAAAVASACGGGGDVSEDNRSDGSAIDASRPDATPSDSATSTDSGLVDSGKIDSGNDSGHDSGIDSGVDAALDADAAPPLPTGCSGSTDPHWAQVTTYIPCTVDLTDSTGKSTIQLYNAPTVAATPAGAPGGASCNLGNAGTGNSANGFGVTLPAALGVDDFTVEISVYQTEWYEPTDQQSEILISSTAYPPAAGGFPAFFSHKNTNLVQFIGGAGGQNYTYADSVLTAWQSFAASRVGGTTYVFRNGTLLSSFVDATDYTDTVFYVGHQANGSYNAVMGAVGQIRITTAGRYSADYQSCPGSFATN